MISDVSKRKLKAFQFIEGALEDDKENFLPPEERPIKKRKPLNELAAITTTRIPLNHLIGQLQDSKTLEVLVYPTEEVVHWKQTTPRPSQFTPAKNKNKTKRSFSSSPPSANKSIKTPKPDPALEVWHRYNNGNFNESAARASQSGLDNLLIDSSPRSSETAGSVSGLRRYNSCGVQFPASRKKRPRKAPSISFANICSSDPPSAKERNQQPHAPLHQTVSKVALLLEEAHKIHSAEQARADAAAATAADTNHFDPDIESPLQNRAERLSRPSIPGPLIEVESQESLESEQDDDDPDLDLDIDQFDTLFASLPSKEREAPPIPTPPPPLFRADSLPSKSQSIPLSQQSQQRPLPTMDIEDFYSSTPTSVLPSHVHNPPPVQFGPFEPKRTVNIESDNADDDDFFDNKDWDNLCDNTITPGMQQFTAKGHRHDENDNNDDNEDDDEVDFDDIENALMVSTSRQEEPLPQDFKPPFKSSIQRYLIMSIQQSTYQDAMNRVQAQKVLILESEKANSTTTKTVFLRQSWLNTQCARNAFVHIIGQFDSNNICIIDNDSNMLILHPDHLVSATVVADSFGCIRRAVLQDRVKATSQSSAPMLYGNLLHELFQQAISRNTWHLPFLKQTLSLILPRHFETMSELGINTNQVAEYLTPRLQEMTLWADKFVRKHAHPDAITRGRNGERRIISVNKLLDIEEHVWSPNYGLKGNIDATVEITIDQEDHGTGHSQRRLTVPFELKTGKRVSEAHQAQTALYTLLVSDRYDLDVTDGILYYLETSETMRVKAVRQELIHMIMKRNELACYIRERLKLPVMLEPAKQRMCDNCYAKTTCHLYHKLSENGDGSLIEKREVFQQTLASLQPRHQQFFQKWDSLITKEESEMMRFRRELWTMLSTERQQLNRCFAHLVMDNESAVEQPHLNKINQYQYNFVKQNHEAGFSFTESQITVGEPIVISDEAGHFALANGYVTHLHKRRISVAVDRRLRNARVRKQGFDRDNCQTFTGIMEIGPDSSAVDSNLASEPMVYRIDKDEFSNGMALVRNNLLQIMDDSVAKAVDLRRLIVENQPPKFNQTSSGWTLQTQTWQTEMNSDQQRAIEKVLAAEDYALVLGMPGTGKTTTIAHIIRCLVSKGKTVLLTSYTHSAVDNILLKVRGAGFDVLRLGVRAKIHPTVQDFAILASEPKASLQDLHDAWHKPPVVATSCLGVNYALFSQRTFDYCIVDEASQITLPVCLGPIRMAKTFVLVGDHFQLPPLVQNKEALEGGLDMSLFRMLSEQHPEAVVSLEHQYRMTEDIMTLSNTLIYSGRLKCGNRTVAKRSLSLLHRDSVAQSSHHDHQALAVPASSMSACLTLLPNNDTATSCLINRIINPQCKVIFVNTDPLGSLAHDCARVNRMTNPLEAHITALLASTLMHAGLSAQNLGIVTFYRSQLAMLRHAPYSSILDLTGRGLGLELHTADKFQGRDKEAIIVSFVRSNEANSLGNLLSDWRRINVAVTRARSKLVLIGSANTLAQGGGEVLNGLVHVCREKGWMLDLPVNAIEGHVWASTPGSSLTQMQSPPKGVRLNRETLGKKWPLIDDILNDIM